MKIITESVLLLIIIALSRVYYTNGQLITKNILKKDLNSSKNQLNEFTLKHKKEFIIDNSNASIIERKENIISIDEQSNLNLFLQINHSRNKNDKNKQTCNIANCYMPHGVCIENTFCKCSKYYGNLLMIDLIERIKVNNNENFISKLMLQNKINYYFAHYFQNFHSDYFCSYHKKRQLIAFILESLFLVGIGHFYLNRFFHGLFKVLMILLIIFFFFSMKKCKIEVKFFISITSDKFSFDYFLNFMYFIFMLCFFTIHTVDLIMIANNKYKDGFGFTMISWNSLNSIIEKK